MDSYKITFDAWDKVASLYQDTFMDLDLYNDTYDQFCSLVPKNDARILEIGCGPGNITRYLLAKKQGFQIEAIDVSPNMLALAKKNNPGIETRVMDCRDIDQLGSNYDAILCGFCLPYLSKDDCEKLIKDSSALLNTGGIIYLSAIEGDYSLSGYEAGSSGDKMYVYYHQEDHIQQQFKTHGFESIAVSRKNYSKRDGTTSTHLVLIAKKL